MQNIPTHCHSEVIIRTYPGIFKLEFNLVMCDNSLESFRGDFRDFIYFDEIFFFFKFFIATLFIYLFIYFWLC